MFSWSGASKAESSDTPESQDHLCEGALEHGKSGRHMQLSSKVCWLNRQRQEVGSSADTAGVHCQLLDMTSGLKFSHRHDL